ncbi:MAG: thiosulfate oxidation carrier complex protein SoxZ [Acetobacteraceae bacterium]|nr:thiosulfate oxidation carrier complex protein SoxZ [Acetobacteraceae bacterium]
MARVLVNVPKQVAKGVPFDVKVLISHPMESGQRRGVDGQVIPRKIINRFVCTLDGEEVVSLDLFPAIAANPFLAFSVTAEASGTLSMTWVDDDGAVQTQLAQVTVV